MLGTTGGKECKVDMKIKEIIFKAIEFFKLIDKKWKNIRNKSKISKILTFFPSNVYIMLLLFCSLCIMINDYISNNNTIMYRENYLYTDNVGAIYDKPIHFNLLRDNVKGNFNILSIKFATYERVNDADYNLKVLKNKKITFNKDFNTKKFEDNQYVDFYLNKTIDNDLLEQYTVKITPIHTDMENNITVLCDKETKNIAVAYKEKKNIINITTTFILLWVVIIFLIIKIVEKKNINQEKFFLFSLVFVVFASIITPPYQVPDERVHYLRTLQLSQYNFSNTPYDNLKQRDITVPSNLDDVNYSQAESRDAVNDFSDIFKSLYSEKIVSKTYNSSVGGSAVVVAYIVPAIVIKIVNLFTNSPLIMFYVGRFACLLINCIIIYFAIKFAPKFKNTILVVALMPMTIQSMISYSYDGLLNSCCLLFVAICLKLMIEYKEMEKKELIKCYISSILLLALIICIKLPYGLLGIIYLFLPSIKSNGFLKKIPIMLIMCGLSYGITISLTKILSIGTPSTTAAIISNGESNLSYIIANPKQILIIAKNTFKLKMSFYIDSLVGYFGYFTIKLNSFFHYLYALIAAVLMASEENILKNKEKIIYFFTVLIIVAGIFGALYFAWSGYQLPYVEGVQGRYFIPLILPIVLIFTTKKVKIECNNNLIYECSSIILLNYLTVILVHYF